MSTLISGSTGYIGGALFRSLLAAGEEVFGFDSSRPSLQHVDKPPALFSRTAKIGDLALALEKNKITRIVHAATAFTRGAHESDIRQVVDANLVFSINLLEASIAAGVQEFVSLGSYWQVGSLAPSVELSSCPYTASKIAFSSYLDSRSRNFDQVAELFLPDTFGPLDRRGKLVEMIIRGELAGKPMTFEHPRRPLLLSYSKNMTSAVTASLSGKSKPLPRRCFFIDYFGETPRSLQSRIQSILVGSSDQPFDCGENAWSELPWENISNNQSATIDLALRETISDLQKM